MLKWKDAYGNQIGYGDIIENFERRIIGKVVRSSFNNQPVMRIISQFSIKAMTYLPPPDNSTDLSLERNFIPKHSKLYWILHNYRIDNIEILRSGNDNER